METFAVVNEQPVALPNEALVVRWYIFVRMRCVQEEARVVDIEGVPFMSLFEGEVEEVGGDWR